MINNKANNFSNFQMNVAESNNFKLNTTFGDFFESDIIDWRAIWQINSFLYRLSSDKQIVCNISSTFMLLVNTVPYTNNYRQK